MAIKLPSKPKLALYATLSIAGAIAVGWFFSEREAPELTSFEISAEKVSISQDQGFSFSGSMRDERGVTDAQFECVQDGESKFIIFVAMQGNDRNRVSFGRISGTSTWTGRWSGSAYDFEFEGIATLTETFEPANCTWYASLGDIIGNKTYFDTGVSLEITE